MPKKKNSRRKRKTTKPVICPYCESPAELVDSTEVYQQDYDKKLWLCRPCDAYVGTHRHSEHHAPLGTLANATLRQLRLKVHQTFDPLWLRKMQQEDMPKQAARTAGYQWLASEMGIKAKHCHIAHFNETQCEQVLKLCQPYADRLQKN